ncbi:uncharacterized protein [Eurosta solidaginis]|uniref:uncharacterized protein isoform X2 n=1 Tax=Eurosta solidaginis TaxID=178769 RepID=UPI0035312CAB
MKKFRRWQLITASLFMLITGTTAAAPFKKVSISTTSATTTTTTSTTTEAPSTEANSDSSSGTTKNSKLTGIPQIDYIWDPNLPRELRGYNLSSYPFFSTVPPEEDIHFKCDGLHDGFYASIEHKCQVYHHCVYGIRHDFLCANFTAFDQRTFICHFVSDVDCEGSKNYWNRNDDLYMATTTSTTTTTTTEPPPTQRRRIIRPLRPLRRPINRRPIDDYYYEEEEEPAAVYEDDYYEDHLNRRRKPKPRQRKPIAEYDEDYTEDKPRRHNLRDRFRDEEELEEDYDTDRRTYDRPNVRNKPAERRKSGARKTTPAAARLNGEERRRFTEDRATQGRKDKSRITPSTDTIDLPPRRLTGRRRINEKRTSPSGIDDLDDYENPQSNVPDQEEAAEEEAPPKVKTTPKPLDALITPKAGSGSVFARPRAPPRIAPPVPLNEKKKFSYPIQKTGTTPSPDITHLSEEEYYEDEAYDDMRPQRIPTRRRIVDSKLNGEEEGLSSRRRNQNDTPLVKKPSRTTIRRPTTTKKHAVVSHEDEYDSVDGGGSLDPFDSHSGSRKRLFSTRNRSSFGPPVGRGADDVDFVDDDYEEQPLRPVHRLRPKAAARKGTKKPRRPIEEDEEFYEQEPEPLHRNRAITKRPKTNANARLRHSTATTTTPAPIEDPAAYVELEEVEVEEEVPSAPAAVSKGSAQTPSGRTATVRVVKRPFLPSRGGSPYLPRGLQPVGVALKPLSTHTTDSTPIDMGSTISCVRLLEHGAPILRDSGSVSAAKPALSHLHDLNNHERETSQDHRTTLPPRSALPVSQAREPEPQPKITLDELYENDYDVTLNDALNPTLKPLSPHHSIRSNHNNAFENAYASEPGISEGARSLQRHKHIPVKRITEVSA